MSEKNLKVTDRRMFTPEGLLRDEFRHLEDAKAPAASDVEVSAAATTEEEPTASASTAPPVSEVPEIPALRQAAGYPNDEGSRRPQFMDLASMLIEPASVYLREAQAARSGDLRAVSEASQNLEMARLHIDLLTVLREKSASNLEARELAMLDDVIYRLQMAFVQAQE